MTHHWDYHREREADVLRALRRHPLAEVHPKERRLPLVRLMRLAGRAWRPAPSGSPS